MIGFTLIKNLSEQVPEDSQNMHIAHAGDCYTLYTTDDIKMTYMGWLRHFARFIPDLVNRSSVELYRTIDGVKEVVFTCYAGELEQGKPVEKMALDWSIQNRCGITDPFALSLYDTKKQQSYTISYRCDTMPDLSVDDWLREFAKQFPEILGDDNDNFMLFQGRRWSKTYTSFECDDYIATYTSQQLCDLLDLYVLIGPIKNGDDIPHDLQLECVKELYSSQYYVMIRSDQLDRVKTKIDLTAADYIHFGRNGEKHIYEVLPEKTDATEIIFKFGSTWYSKPISTKNNKHLAELALRTNPCFDGHLSKTERVSISATILEWALRGASLE